MTELLSVAVVGTFGVFLCALGCIALVAPAKANRFLLGFATTATKHYLEMLVRMIVAVALLQIASQMPFSTAFKVFAWMLLLSSIGLSLVPWRWHHRFASTAVPIATRFISLIGVCALAGGAFLIWALANARFV